MVVRLSFSITIKHDPLAFILGNLETDKPRQPYYDNFSLKILAKDFKL